MTYNEIHVLDNTERNPIKVQLSGSNISIADCEDEIQLTSVEAIKLIEILCKHFQM